MQYMLVRNTVRDFDTWKVGFGADLARDAGLGVVRVRRSLDDPGQVHCLLSITDMDKAKDFVNDPASAAAGICRRRRPRRGGSSVPATGGRTRRWTPVPAAFAATCGWDAPLRLASLAFAPAPACTTEAVHVGHFSHPGA